MKKIILLFISIAIINVSCLNLWGETDLGNNFTLIEADKDDISIIYCTTNNCTSGITIVPSKVIDYKFNSKWIIAKTQSDSDSILYWIIDKNIEAPKESDISSKLLFEKLIDSHITGPVNLSEFQKELVNRDIDLTFK
ncbi:hypothetical protein FACS1894169_06180 [Bacteroidia bacterium]|nr:hypothetical protein FACS1894169_06180 [Bacteroidia bacterium]